MEQRRRRSLIIAGLLIVCVSVIGWETARRLGQTQTRVVEGTIVQVNVATHRASVEIIHPKTGKPLRIEGIVPAECDIQIDGVPARMEDLCVGEHVRTEGTIHPDYTIVANWVRVSRQAVPAASPATATQPALTP